MKFLKSLYAEEPVADEAEWHKRRRAPLFARIEGHPNPFGQVWRRKLNGHWEYKQDDETADQYADRQW